MASTLGQRIARREGPVDTLEALSRLDAPALDLAGLAEGIQGVLAAGQLSAGSLLARSGPGGVEVLHQDLQLPASVHARLLRMLERPAGTDVDVVLAPYRFRIAPLGAPAGGAPFALALQPGPRFQTEVSSAVHLAVSLLRMKVASLPGTGERRLEPRIVRADVHVEPEDTRAADAAVASLPGAARERRSSPITTARLAHLYQILRLLEPSQAPAEIARTLLPYLADFVTFDVAGLLLTERGRATATVMPARPISKQAEDAFVTDLIDAHASQCPAPPDIESCDEHVLAPRARRGEDALPGDPADSWETRQRPRSTTPAGTGGTYFASRLSLPIITRTGRFVGQLVVGARVADRYGEDELVILSGLVSYLSSLLDSRRLFLELEHQAKMDEMTELYNYRTFRQLLSAELSRAARYGKPLSVVMIDVDHFKSVNDTYGHPRGDEVLRSIARLLARTRRRVDIVARYGGEEFALILPETTLEGARQVAERIRSRVERTRIMKERPVTISAGVATIFGGPPRTKSPNAKSGALRGATAATPDDSCVRGHTDDQLIARADAALYRAKRKGRNRVEAAGK